MAKYIDRDDVIALIEDKQKKFCPRGAFSRHAIYGSDRDKFDQWQEIADAIEGLPTIEISEPTPNDPLSL